MNSMSYWGVFAIYLDCDINSRKNFTVISEKKNSKLRLLFILIVTSIRVQF